MLDGEFLVLRDGAIAPFNDLQQRLNRKLVTPTMLADFPAWVRLYDIFEQGGEDLRSPISRGVANGSRLGMRGAAAGVGYLALDPLYPMGRAGHAARRRA